jgi:hypothetical protein
MRSPKGLLRNEILSVLEEMAVKAPEETAYFLEKSLKSAGDNEQIAWYVRKSLNCFPTESRSILRQVLVG